MSYLQEQPYDIKKYSNNAQKSTNLPPPNFLDKGVCYQFANKTIPREGSSAETSTIHSNDKKNRTTFFSNTVGFNFISDDAESWQGAAGEVGGIS